MLIAWHVFKMCSMQFVLVINILIHLNLMHFYHRLISLDWYGGGKSRPFNWRKVTQPKRCCKTCTQLNLTYITATASDMFIVHKCFESEFVGWWLDPVSLATNPTYIIVCSQFFLFSKIVKSVCRLI